MEALVGGPLGDDRGDAEPSNDAQHHRLSCARAKTNYLVVVWTAQDRKAPVHPSMPPSVQLEENGTVEMLGAGSVSETPA